MLFRSDTLIDNGSVASGTIDLSTAIVNDVDNGDENLYIAQVDGNTVDSINGYTSSVSFTYSVGTDTFTINADVTIKQDGTYTIDNIGDLNPIPDGIQAVATINFSIADPQGVLTTTTKAFTMSIEGDNDAPKANTAPVSYPIGGGNVTINALS